MMQYAIFRCGVKQKIEAADKENAREAVDWNNNVSMQKTTQHETWQTQKSALKTKTSKPRNKNTQAVPNKGMIKKRSEDFLQNSSAG